MPRTRMKPEARKDLIAEAAIVTCRRLGFGNLTRKAVAVEAGVAEASVSRYFNTMKQLRRYIIRRALRTQDPEILSQMLGYPEYKNMLSPEDIEVAKTHLTAG